MKERPILMSAPMVCATLRVVEPKTHTRRGVKWKGVAPGLNLGFSGLRAVETTGGWVLESDSRTSCEWRCTPTPCPYGQPGDRLWVREAWSTHACFDHLPPRDCPSSIHYAADGQIQTGKGRPSIHMPRWASRILLEVVSVRVERLNDISEADAIAEGCTKNHNGYFWGGPHPESGLKQLATSKGAFRDLWESINGAGSWEANPWVWVVEFKRVPAC